MVGATLVTVAGFTRLLVLPQQLRGHAENPYTRIILFVILPIAFILGLALIATGPTARCWTVEFPSLCPS